MQKNQVLFTILFEDNSVFLGGLNYNETRWPAVPRNKKIARIFYTLPDGNTLLLSKYEKYFHMIEATQDLTGKDAGKTRLRYAYIMGKEQDEVVVYRISLAPTVNNDIGDIKRVVFKETDDFIKGLNPEGWRG